MAGYMGFGMQSWLYKRRPRKPFSKRGRVPSFEPLPKYSRTFVLKPKVKENSKVIALLLVLPILSLFGLMISWKQDFMEYSQEHRDKVEESIKLSDEKAFVFLINSGKGHLRSNRYVDAYNEFNLAYNINSENEELNKLLTETLYILSTKEENYKVLLNNFIKLDE